MVAMRSSTLSSAQDALTERIIGAAITVHRTLGPGLLEGIYQNALAVELSRQQIDHRREVQCGVTYQSVRVGEQRLDLIVADQVIVELKAVEPLTQIHKAQLLTYLRATGLTIGLLLNFGTELIQVKRVLNTHKSSSSSHRPSAPPS